MAASYGAYRVQAYYVETQCDVSCDKTYSGNINSAYFDATTTPTVTFTFSPKTGYMITDIAIDSSDTYNVTYEIIGGNKVKVTASSDVVSGNDDGNIAITVTTAEAINDLSTLFTKIANAIRAKTGKTGQIKATNFHSEIATIQTGGSFVAGYTMSNHCNTHKNFFDRLYNGKVWLNGDLRFAWIKFDNGTQVYLTPQGGTQLTSSPSSYNTQELSFYQLTGKNYVDGDEDGWFWQVVPTNLIGSVQIAESLFMGREI